MLSLSCWVSNRPLVLRLGIRGGLGALGLVLEPLEAVLGLSWDLLEWSQGGLRLSWGGLGASWGILGQSWVTGAVLAALGELLGRYWPFLG